LRKQSKDKVKIKLWGSLKGLKIEEKDIEKAQNFGKGIIIPKKLYEKLVNALESWLVPCDCDMENRYQNLLKEIKSLNQEARKTKEKKTNE